jgi:serine/threonine-protein kinase
VATEPVPSEPTPDQAYKRRAEARVGSMLRDKWRIDGLLGFGGMAAVFAATHRNGKRAAVKILHAEAALVPDIRARFLREGYLANKVGHPGAVSILDDDVDVDGTVFLVMELLEGQTLESAREADVIGCDELLIVAHHVLDVLAAAHDKSIVHRDLKPANVFVCSDGSVKILDFGIARLQSMTPAPSGGTGRDSALGTPGYMPPEQARGRWDAVDGQSDLWSVGATLFAVLAGRPVHQSGTLNEQLLAAMTVPAPPLLSLCPDAPTEVADLVDRALRFEKEERFPNARAMQSEVARVYEALAGKPMGAGAPLSTTLRHRSPRIEAPTLAATQHPIPSADSARPKRTSPLVGIAAGLVAAGVMGLIGFLTRSGSAPRAGVPVVAATTASELPAATSLPTASPSPSIPAASSSASAAAPSAAAPSAAVSATDPLAGSRKRSSAKPSESARAEANPATSAKPAPDPFGRRK